MRTYTARIVESPGEGIRLEPTEDSGVPEHPSEINLLGLAVALALGSAGYEHHPEPRNTEIQTIEALLEGTATMPWRSRPAGAAAGDASGEAGGEAEGAPETAAFVVCERSESGVSKCRVEHRPVEPQ
ncbi:hypothetical protein GCM10023194_32510 [Planotetraspora phitsanulokensis]|uniref:Uncharacterized protein n=1 Tax=Planotetraspora phitsanulokensis TaxID=575192 RepID=A0A8J3UAN8_9ACTN|nr:hypothetical protein [Planotetraspora phitsanulokensis]GII35610.1 hypothetical protein Pph01_06130 [Planotetraspora phitsanulokensis]